MTNIRTGILLAMALSVLCLQTAVVFAAPLHQKPQHPLQISIAPAPGADLDAIKAGDVVEFAATATAARDASDMRITIKLSGGAELVSGDLFWSGSVQRREPHSVRFSVRVPEQGAASIQAQASITAGGKKELTAKTRFLLMTGAERQEQRKAKTSRPVKKDSKGRTIVEY